MRSHVTDVEALGALRPLEIATYLRASGWIERPAPFGEALAWHTADEDYEVLLPLSRRAPDFLLRVSDLLATLAAQEERSEPELLRDLSLSTADVVRVRVQPTQSDDGTISLDDGVALVENARALVLAAACSTVRPQALYPTRKPADAAEYIRRVRLGQTERGSFIVTVVSPVAPILDVPPPGQLFPDTREPFERRVTRTLMGALSAAHEAAQDVIGRGAGIAAFREVVGQGVSANLCDAIVGIAGDAGRPMSVRMAWSLARPMNVATVEPEVTFDPDALTVLNEASRLLKESAPLDGVTLVGSITRLDRSTDDGPGEVVLTAAIPEISGNAPRGIKIALNEGPYHEALVAHDRGYLVTVTGDLRKEGRQWWLEQPRDLSFQPSD